ATALILSSAALRAVRCLKASAHVLQQSRRLSSDLVGGPFKIRPLHSRLATVESTTQHQLTVEEQQRLGAPITVVPQLAPDVRVIGFPYEFEENFTLTNHFPRIYVAPEGVLYNGRISSVRLSDTAFNSLAKTALRPSPCPRRSPWLPHQESCR